MKRILLFSILLAFKSYAEVEPKTEIPLRFKIGPVYHPPIQYQSKLYFYTGGGVLIESNYEQTTAEPIFQGHLASISPTAIDGDHLYFGEGMHKDQNASLFIFDLKKKKLLKEIKTKGHIERKVAFDNKNIYIPAGPAGLIAVDKKDYKIKWSFTKHNNLNAHVDSNPILYKNLVCFNTIYETTHFICVNKDNGKLDFKLDLKKPLKGELSLQDDTIFGFATSASPSATKFDIPSNFVAIDLKLKKIKFEKELRGHNYFAPLPITKDEVAFGLSTGDLLTFNLNTGDIGYISEFAEPFISTSFRLDDQLCFSGVMGKILCFKKDPNSNKYSISKDDRIMEHPIGNIASINGTTYIPTRTGYYLMK